MILAAAPARAAALAAALALAGCGARPPAATPPAPPTATETRMAFPTLPPTATATPAPTSTPTPDLGAVIGARLYEDDFALDRGWPLGPSPSGGAALLNGRLAVTVRVPRAALFLRAPAPQAGDAYIEVSARSELCSGPDEFGLMTRLSPLGDHYRFTVTCDGQARAVRVVDGALRALTLLAPSDAVAAGAPNENHLAVWVRGPDLSFAVNGLEVLRVRDRALTAGGFGLFLRAGPAGQLTVSFDDLRIDALEAAAP